MPAKGLNTTVIPKVRSPKCWGHRETVCAAIGNTASLLCSVLVWQSPLMELPIDVTMCVKCEVIQFLKAKHIEHIEIHCQITEMYGEL